MKPSKNFVSEYKTIADPSTQEKARNWDIAIGLQQVDGLTPSEYLIETAKENIDGKISHAEVRERLHKYYQTEDGIKQGEDVKEADLVSERISDLLGNPSFTFSPITLLGIHEYLFQETLPPDWVGQIRTKDITKSEDVLNGDTVTYGWSRDIKKALDYNFDKEQGFNYSGLSAREQIEHIAKFISGIWQIHPFREGNTRTIAVFAIKYLQNKGMRVGNELFREHSAYFRNALVRANYENLELGVIRTTKYLDSFFGNLLLGENNTLDNKDLHIKK
jgi:fido (protein-threonine AMPylation protein)